MPVTKSATKKLRQDKKRTVVNNKKRKQVADTIKAVKKSKKNSVDEAFSKIDKASKGGIFHANKAARLKSKLSKIAPKKTSSATKASATKKSKSAK